MRIVVVGAGAMGSLVAGRLAASGADVVLLGRASLHLQAIAERGLRLDSPEGMSNLVSLVATAAATVARSAHVALVLVKAWTTTTALEPLAPYLPPGSLIVTLQNGLGNRERIRSALPDHSQGSVAAGVTTEGALRPEAGRVIHTGHGETVLGLPDGISDTRVDDVATLLSRAGLPTAVVADIEPSLWRKLAINAAINGLTALGNVENGAIADDRDFAAVATLVANEVAAVAAAWGIGIADAAAATLVVARATGRNRSSMLRDLDRGERTEVDAIHGAIVERARAVGMEAPLCATLAALIRARERFPGGGGRDGR